MIRILILSICLAISGCAAFTNLADRISKRNSAHASYIGTISDAEAATVAKDMAQFLSDQMPPAKTTIEIGQRKSPFQDMLIANLITRGFGVVESKPEPDSQAVMVRYAITQLNGGVLVRMKYQGKEASRFYDRTALAGLSMQNIYTLREAIK